jgi:CheY-like chemotaxis protein
MTCAYKRSQTSRVATTRKLNDEALTLREAATREKPDLILMDLSLPVLTGWDAAPQPLAEKRY